MSGSREGPLHQASPGPPPPKGEDLEQGASPIPPPLEEGDRPQGGGGGVSTDVFSPEKRSAVMARVKGRDTMPEKRVRALLTKLGARYRLHRADLPGKPDIVLPGRRLAIFVHGCFWHGHDCPRGARIPKANRDYWLAKIGRNHTRDLVSQERLAALGWRAEVVWECELKDAPALAARLDALLTPSKED
ncbi:MAG: DNA mismatch endonuclease Vsr [Caulobacteraceae bacterium]|nr:DNA mismatch endonuclease Vsr [Caulobacteraceae bacterium]